MTPPLLPEIFLACPGDDDLHADGFAAPGSSPVVFTAAVEFWNPDQLRDEQGRWTDSGDTSGAPHASDLKRVAGMQSSGRAMAAQRVANDLMRSTPFAPKPGSNTAPNVLAEQSTETLWSLRAHSHGEAFRARESLAIAQGPEFRTHVAKFGEIERARIDRGLDSLRQIAAHHGAEADAIAHALADPKRATDRKVQIDRTTAARAIVVDDRHIAPEDHAAVHALMATLPKAETLAGKDVHVHVVPKRVDPTDVAAWGVLGRSPGVYELAGAGHRLFDAAAAPPMVEVGAARKGSHPHLYKRISRTHYLRADPESAAVKLIHARDVPALARHDPGAEFSAATVAIETEFNPDA